MASDLRLHDISASFKLRSLRLRYQGHPSRRRELLKKEKLVELALCRTCAISSGSWMVIGLKITSAFFDFRVRKVGSLGTGSRDQLAQFAGATRLWILRYVVKFA